MNSYPNKKRTFAAALTVGALAMAGCGNGDDGEGGAGDLITLRAGTLYDSTFASMRCGLHELADDPALEEMGLALDVVGDAQLGSESELLEQASAGELDIAFGIGSILATTFGIPELEMFEAYYLYDTVEDVERVQSTEVAQEAWATLEEEANLVMMGLPWLYGERHVFGSVPVQGPEDLQGVDFRVPNTDISRDSAAAMGANPASVEFAELYLALQQGVTDVAEAPLANIQIESFDEVAEYVSLTGHLITTMGVVINGDRWESLSDEQREFLDERVTELAAEVADCMEADDAEAVEGWEANDTLELVEDVDRDTLRELVEENYSEGYPWSEDYLALLEELGR